MKWETTTIGEHCTVTSSKRFHLSDRSASGIPFYCSKEIIQKVNGYEVTECDYIREELYEQVKEQFGVPVAGDLLITTRGTYGIPYIYSDTDRFYFADGNLTWLKDFDLKLNPKFLFYWVKSHEGQGKISAIAKGTAQKAVPIASIKMIKFPLPSINEQKQIISILSAYDDLIENNQKQIKLLEETAQLLYKEWFVDLHFPDYETTPVVNGVPEGWEQQSLGEIASVLRRGISPQYDDSGKYCVISQKCIRQSIMDISEARREAKDYMPELNLQDMDTVICSTGTGTLGRVGQVFGIYPDTTFDSHVTLVRTEKYQNFIYQSIKYQQGFLMGMGRGSTNQQELYRRVIEDLQIFIPAAEILNQAENMFSAVHDKVTSLNSQIMFLVEARDRLLPKLMSGEIEV